METDSSSSESINALASKKASITELLESALKVSTLVAGTLYTTGLIVASLKLAQLGVVSTDFVKPLYVLTGAWAWLPAVIAVAMVFTGREALALVVPPIETRRQKFIAGFAIIIVAVVFVAFICALPMIANLFLGSMGFGPNFAATALGLVLFLTLAVVVVDVVAKGQNRAGTGRVFFPSLAAMGMFFAALYILGFSLTMYGQIPAQLGGGGRRNFALFIDDLKIRYSITGNHGAESPILTPVIAETSTSFVVPAPRARLDDYSLNPALSSTWDWGAQTVFERSFVIIPKTAVSVATVLGGEPKMSPPTPPPSPPSPTPLPSPTPAVTPIPLPPSPPPTTCRRKYQQRKR